MVSDCQVEAMNSFNYVAPWLGLAWLELGCFAPYLLHVIVRWMLCHAAGWGWGQAWCWHTDGAQRAGARFRDGPGVVVLFICIYILSSLLLLRFVCLPFLGSAQLSFLLLPPLTKVKVHNIWLWTINFATHQDKCGWRRPAGTHVWALFVSWQFKMSEQG